MRDDTQRSSTVCRVIPSGQASVVEVIATPFFTITTCVALVPTRLSWRSGIKAVETSCGPDYTALTAVGLRPECDIQQNGNDAENQKY